MNTNLERENCHEAWQRQNEWLLQLSEQLIENNTTLKTLSLKSFCLALEQPEDDASDAELMHAGTMASHSRLNRKQRQLGIPWQANNSRITWRLPSFLYGGIDSDGVTTRLKSPNGIMAAVTVRMANDLSCRAVANDFVLPALKDDSFRLWKATICQHKMD